MKTIKEQVLKEFPDAKCVSVKKDMFVIKSSKGNGISKYTEEEAWIDFKNRSCNPLPQLPMNYKELVLEKFPNAKLINGFNHIEVSISSNRFLCTKEEWAWESFYNMYCTDKSDLITGEEYEFSDEGEEWVKDTLRYFGGNREIYSYIRPIQNNPKLDQLKQLAEELGYNLTKQ